MTIRVTSDVRRKLQASAESIGRNFSDWARDILLFAAPAISLDDGDVATEVLRRR